MGFARILNSHFVKASSQTFTCDVLRPSQIRAQEHTTFALTIDFGWPHYIWPHYIWPHYIWPQMVCIAFGPRWYALHWLQMVCIALAPDGMHCIWPQMVCIEWPHYIWPQMVCIALSFVSVRSVGWGRGIEGGLSCGPDCASLLSKSSLATICVSKLSGTICALQV